MDIPVECVSQDNRIHILESHSSLAVEQQRSELLLDLACSEGTFRLPISQRGLDLLQEAGKSIKHGKQWTERRFSDLGRVAEVRASISCECSIEARAKCRTSCYCAIFHAWYFRYIVPCAGVCVSV